MCVPILSNLWVFYRVKDWFYLVPSVFLGMLYKNVCFYSSINNILQGILFSITYFGFGYALNDLADKKTISVKEWILVALPLIILYLQMITLSFILFLFLVIIHIVNVLYSFPPFHLKRKYVISTLTNIFTFAYPFLVGMFIEERRISLDSIIFFLFVAIIFIPIQLLHEWAHLEEDKRIVSLRVHRRYYLWTLLFWTIVTAISFYVDMYFRFRMVFFMSSLLFSLSNIITMITYISSVYVSEEIERTRKLSRIWGIFYGSGWVVSFVLFKC